MDKNKAQPPATAPTTEDSVEQDLVQEVVNLEKLTQDLAVAKKQAEEHLDGWRRARADYSNLKKETDKRQTELVQFANAALLAQLLPVYDNLKKAWQHLPPELAKDEWVKGIEQIKNQLRDFFNKLGITEIKTVGEKFNPQYHEAVLQVEEPGDSQTIIEELQPGYLLNKNVLVPAKVKIIK